MLSAERILIIEDEPMIALDLRLALAEAGATVVGVASTVDEASKLAETPGLTGAIIDLRLNGQSVRSSVQRLAERDIPFLFYSGHDDAPTARSWPTVPLLTKPQDTRAIIEMLKRIILRSAGREAAARRET